MLDVYLSFSKAILSQKNLLLVLFCCEGYQGSLFLYSWICSLSFLICLILSCQRRFLSVQSKIALMSSFFYFFVLFLYWTLAVHCTQKQMCFRRANACFSTNGYLTIASHSLLIPSCCMLNNRSPLLITKVRGTYKIFATKQTESLIWWSLSIRVWTIIIQHIIYLLRSLNSWKFVFFVFLFARYSGAVILSCHRCHLLFYFILFISSSSVGRLIMSTPLLVEMFVSLFTLSIVFSTSYNFP